MKIKGFTLIEVLVAVAILAIALFAIVRSSTQITGNTAYLQEKTIAYLVARNILAEAKSGVLSLPHSGSANNGNLTMLNRQWIWHLQIQPTADAHIEAIHVTVTAINQSQVLATLTSFVAIDDQGQTL